MLCFEVGVGGVVVFIVVVDCYCYVVGDFEEWYDVLIVDVC